MGFEAKETVSALHRVTIMLDTPTISLFVRRAEIEGVPKNKDGRIPIDEVLIQLVKAYGDGTYTVLKRPPKPPKAKVSNGAAYLNDKDAKKDGE